MVAEHLFRSGLAAVAGLGMLAGLGGISPAALMAMQPGHLSTPATIVNDIGSTLLPPA